MAAQFAKMRAGFEAATQRCPSATTSNNYEIAGLQVCVRVAGQELAQDLRLAFSHLETDELQCPPDLLIEVWNECETGTPDPSPDRGRHGDEPFYVIEPSPDGRFILDSRNHSSCWLDRRSGHIVASLESAGTQFLDERARPFRRLLSIWLNDRGIQLSHCGLVALHGDGLLFVGNQGVGKSTSALACLQGGFDFLSDDFVALAANGNGAFTGHSLYASCLVHHGHLKNFDELRPYAALGYHAHEAKHVVFLERAFPGRLAQSAPIHAVLLPRVMDAEETVFRPATKGEALLAMAPTAVMFLSTPSTESMNLPAQLVERVPAYWLELGRDVGCIPATVKRLLETSIG